MIPQDFIEEVLTRTDIVEIIEGNVALKKTGKNYQGLCPFHNEKSPSFTVSQDKGFYHCFGCGAHGSALKFLQEHQKMEFIPALEMLAERVGMKLPQRDDGFSEQKNNERRVIFEILEQASKFYKDQLRTHPSRERAVAYLKGRGLSGEIARDFDLGYSIAKWDSLQTYLVRMNFDNVFLNKSGMLIERDDGDHTYDRFRDRIMFPIKDLRGNVIGFGGRVVGDGKPKYLNSPETPMFDKGRTLYNLVGARSAVGRDEPLIVTEGYMDVIALHSGNFNGAIAPLGTAITEQQLQSMWRISPEPIIALDGDKAGLRAAYRLIDLSLPLLKTGQALRFSLMPEGKDPDDLIRNEGPSFFKNLIEEAIPMVDLIWKRETYG